MIRSMQRRLTAVLLCFLLVLFTCISTANYLSVRANLDQNLNALLRQAVQSNPVPTAPGDSLSTSIPYFSILVNRNGQALMVQSGQFDLSDSATVQNLIAFILTAEEDTGYLADYRLNYIRLVTRDGWRIVCADDSLRQQTLDHQMRSSLMLGLGLLPVFWLLSWLLARFLLRPVRRAWEQQTQFIADASHELKTPLTVILSNTDMILADCPAEDESLARRAGNIKLEGDRMRGLVMDMLALARSDEGIHTSEPATPVNLSSVAENTCLAFDALSYEQGLTLTASIQPDCVVSGREGQLAQLVSILLDNAVKYCLPGGTITVSLCADRRGNALLSVANPSTPLTPEQSSRLFDRFYRADEARSLKSGYGLGLSVARQITDTHRGRIWCEYADGCAVFSIQLPLVKSY